MKRPKQLSILCLGIHFLIASVAVAEEDHLKGYKIKDANSVAAAPNPVTLTNQFGAEDCELGKPQFFLVQSEKNGGDDPRGGPAGDFVCYKAKCTGAVPPLTEADSQFGLHSLETKKAKLVCLPVDPPAECGNDVQEGSEACDGTDASACPGNCETGCTCRQQTVFVSSQTFTGDLDGIAGANQKCQDLADAAGLDGSYKAWLSDCTTSPGASFTQHTTPYVLVDGTAVATSWADLTDNSLLAPITLDENGQTPPSVTHGGSGTQVGIWTWTDTAFDGTGISNLFFCSGSLPIPPCGNWLDANSSHNPTIGKANQANGQWTSWGGGFCDEPKHLYCVEQ
jgi:hypothetical protein